MVWLCSGQGFGDGVVHAVLQQALKTMLSDTTFWRSSFTEEYFTLTPRLTTSLFRKTRIKAFGSLVLLCLYMSGGVSPDPISPFLLLSAMGGDEALLDLEFIKVLAPDCAKTLECWLLDPETPLPSPEDGVVYDNVNNLLIHCTNHQVRTQLHLKAIVLKLYSDPGHQGCWCC